MHGPTAELQFRVARSVDRAHSGHHHGPSHTQLVLSPVSEQFMHLWRYSALFGPVHQPTKPEYNHKHGELPHQTPISQRVFELDSGRELGRLRLPNQPVYS